MNAPLMMRSMVALAKRGRAIVARERLSSRMKKQMSLKATRIPERFAADEAHVVPANEALTHEHVVKVAIVTQNTFLAIFAGEHGFSWMYIDVRYQGLKCRMNDATLGARRKQVTFTVHVLVKLNDQLEWGVAFTTRHHLFQCGPRQFFWRRLD